MDETRALLDALMGPNRNKKEVASSNNPDFAERSICQHALVGFCPHDWFSMPKRQLMPCGKIHSELMKEKFEHHPEVEKYRAWYEEDFLHYLQPIARECDSFIMRERVKCRTKSAGKAVRMPPDVQVRCDELERRHGELVKQSEEAADEASLGLSKEFMGQALVLQEEIDTVKAKHMTEFQGEDICEVCGVKYPLGSGGAEWHDKQSHMKGKTHQGFQAIREKIDELINKRKEWEKHRDARRKEYEPQKEREREQDRRDKDRPREKDRDKDKEDARKRSRSRDRPQRKEVDRSKDKDRDREKARKADRGKDRARSGSDDSRSRRRKEGARSRSGNRKDREASSDRGRRDKDKKKSKGGKSDRSSEAPKRTDSKGRRSPASQKLKQEEIDRRSPVYSRDEPPPPPPEPSSKQPESSDEETQPEDEKDGITVLAEDLPEFWARIQKLKGTVRNEAVAALSSGTKERLEKWLTTRVRKKPPPPPPVV